MPCIWNNMISWGFIKQPYCFLSLISPSLPVGSFSHYLFSLSYHLYSNTPFQSPNTEIIISYYPTFCGHIELYTHTWKFGIRNYGWMWKCTFFFFLSLHCLTKNDFFKFHTFTFTFYGFTFPYSIPCCATYSLSIHMLKDIYVVSIFRLLWVMGL